MTRFTGALLVGALAFLLYRSTLLPGVDFGDTPSFQVMAGSPVISPRDAYPLYFAIGRIFVWFAEGDRAYALNLASAAEAAMACAFVVLLASELAGSLAAGIAAAWLFAGSYTFWSQAVIAEVYALHILFVAFTLFLLLRWEREQTTAALASFLAVYALGFGNHLTMILLAPSYLLFLVARNGWRSILTGRTVALAASFATAGALQYVWNLRGLWLAPVPPQDLLDGLRSAWADVTKSDWRSTMILKVPAAMAGDRIRMYLFDIQQQFGSWGPLLAIAGLLHLGRTAPRRGALLVTAYAVTVAFALSYNVGDSHVFFLPSHLIVAVLAAPGIVWLAQLASLASRGTRLSSTWVAAVVVVAATGRIYEDWPALDRSDDTRPRQWLDALTKGVDDRHALLVTDLNWQLENGLHYFAKETRKDVAVANVATVRPYAQTLIRDNLDIGRDIVLAERAASPMPLSADRSLAAVPDGSVASVTLQSLVGGLARGTRYALCVLRPSREFAIDDPDLRQTLQWLTGDRLSGLPPGDYAALVGVVGQAPSLVQSSDHPFRASVRLDKVPVTVRMESWLAFDTIRRMGFAHVVAGHRHTLIVERGVSFVAFDADGRSLRQGYTAGIFAPQPRYLIQAGR